jgi:DNA polymerase-3 subunit gamma/tau
MSYQVLARRLRPQRFDDLIGQEAVVRTLRNSLSEDKIAHAYLFSGPRGVGKTTAARLLAKALNCEHGPTPEPCGACAACEEIAAGHSLDVLEIDAASNRGIDDVRELRELARIMPVRDRNRLFIIDEAHQLTEPAFNALLKILEEPPKNVFFVLASTERQKFPATILSRCQQLDFRPIATERIEERLGKVAEEEKFELAAGAGQLIARAATGSLRDALSLLERVRAFGGGAIDERAVTEVLGLSPAEALLAIWRGLAEGDLGGVLALIREEERLGRDLRALYGQLVEVLESLLLLACDPQVKVPYPAAMRQALLESAGVVGAPLLLRLLQLALEQRQLIAGAERPGLAVTVAVGRLALWPRLRRVEELLAGAPAGGEAAPSAARAPVRTTGSSPAAAAPAAAPAASDLRSRLADALGARGEDMLAARAAMAREVVAEGGKVVLRFAGAPAATVQSLRDACEVLAAAAAAAGLPAVVEIEEAGTARPAAGAAPSALRGQVEADEGVRRVLEVFGGRIESVEEHS